MLSYLEIGHIIQNDNKIYEEYKDRIKAFVKKNKIIQRNYSLIVENSLFF